MSYRRNLLCLRLRLSHIISMTHLLCRSLWCRLILCRGSRYLFPRLAHICPSDSHWYFFSLLWEELQAHPQYRDNLFICMRLFSSLTFSIFWSISSKFLFRNFLPVFLFNLRTRSASFATMKTPSWTSLHHTRFISISIFTLCLNAPSPFLYLKEKSTFSLDFSKALLTRAPL